MNQAGFPKNLEMLRQGGLGKFRIAIGQKGGEFMAQLA